MIRRAPRCLARGAWGRSQAPRHFVHSTSVSTDDLYHDSEDSSHTTNTNKDSMRASHVFLCSDAKEHINKDTSPSMATQRTIHMMKLSYSTFLTLRKGGVTRPPLVDVPSNDTQTTGSFKKLPRPRVEDLITRPDLRPVSRIRLNFLCAILSHNVAFILLAPGRLSFCFKGWCSRQFSKIRAGWK